MINLLKKMYKIFLYGYKGTSDIYIRYLKNKGIDIGENVTFYEPNTNHVDVQKPWLVRIGNNVEITRGVVIITHDYAWSVIKQATGEIIGNRGKVIIGNNVFIGMNTVILNGVTIGNNVIIGANTLVNKDVPSGAVVVGNPVKVIDSVENYIDKRRKNYINDAVDLFCSYFKRENKIPNKEIFDEFFWIFEKRNMNSLPKKFDYKLSLTGNYQISVDKFLQSDPYFNGYEEFVEFCMKGISNE